MKLFSEIEKTIERGFKRWTERVFGQAQSDELLLVHRAMLEEIEGKVQVLSRGKRVFPYSRLTVTLSSTEADRRTIFQSAFAEGGRLETDVREALAGADCQVPRGFRVEVRIVESETPPGARPFAIEYAADEPKPADRPAELPEAPVPETAGRLVVMKGKAESAE